MSTSNDAIQGVRSVLRRPGWAALVVLILSVGIAFVTMVASLAHSVFLGAVPYDDPDHIVVVWRRGPEPIHQREATSYLNIRDWARGGEPFFDGLAAYTIASSSIQGTEGAQRVRVTYADPYFFDVLDVDMALGRRLTDEDNRPPGGDAVVVLSHGFWSTVLGGDPGVVGTAVDLGGRLHTVVGVMSPRTRWLLREPLEVVAPYRMAALAMGPEVTEDRRTRTSIAVGRLRQGVSLAEARAGMHAVSLALQQEHPDANAGIEAHVTSFTDLRSGFGRLNDVVKVLALAAGLVFFSSCASVTLLLLARFVERSRELAVRMALGAARRSLVTQAVAEGVGLALVAGVVGFALATLGVRAVFAGNPLDLYGFADVTVHRSVFLAALLLALTTTLLFAVVPALRSARIDVPEVLRPAGVGGGRERNHLRRGLIVLQVALSVAVLTGASLVLRSLYELAHADYGFDTQDLVYAELFLDGPRYESDDQARAFYRELAGRVGALPGVSAAGLWGPRLPGSSTWFFSAVPEGRESDPSFEGLHTWYHTVTPGALEDLGLRLVEGRMLDETDHAHALPTAVVSETLARSLWPGKSAVGQRLVDIGRQGWRTVVGVVSDARMRGLGRTHSEMLRDCYVTLDQLPMAQVNVFLRVPGDREAAVRTLREAVRAVDPTRSVFNVSTMQASMAEDRQQTRFLTTLMLLFGAATALLTTLALYGVIAYTVSRRTREIGVRVALGAGRGRIVGLILGPTATDMGFGFAIGLAGALVLGRVMAGQLHGVQPTDPVAFALAAPALLAIALAAAFVPIRRALAVDPSEALRQE
jgi:putative ABC transport system permease protein